MMEEIEKIEEDAIDVEKIFEKIIGFLMVLCNIMSLIIFSLIYSGFMDNYLSTVPFMTLFLKATGAVDLIGLAMLGYKLLYER